MPSFTVEYDGKKHYQNGQDAEEAAKNFVESLLGNGVRVFDEFFSLYPNRKPKNRSWARTEEILNSFGLQVEPVRKAGS